MKLEEPVSSLDSLILHSSWSISLLPGLSPANHTMSLAGSLSASPFLGGIDWAHAYIGLAAFLVFAFVTFTVLLSSRKSKLDYNTGIGTYLKFIYATFLKPHDKSGEGQQGALESFYKTQV